MLETLIHTTCRINRAYVRYNTNISTKTSSSTCTVIINSILAGPVYARSACFTRTYEVSHSNLQCILNKISSPGRCHTRTARALQKAQSQKKPSTRQASSSTRPTSRTQRMPSQPADPFHERRYAPPHFFPFSRDPRGGLPSFCSLFS